MDVLYKRLIELTPEDIQWLVDNKVQESNDLEFKGALSTDDGKPDRWVARGDEIGNEAKSDLIKELVGFANAQGGTLVLGISDDKGKPARADALTPVPKVGELADRLKMACRDGVEPKLHSLEVYGVPCADDGSGVVVLRVNGGSAFGPHRHIRKKECYIRRNDETLPMTMIEIQRHSIELDRRLASIDDTLIRRRKAFLTKVYPTVPRPGFGIFTCAVPLAPIVVANVHRLGAAKPNLETFPVVRGPTEQNPQFAQLPIHSALNWRPVVRGTHVLVTNSDTNFTMDVMDDGSLSIGWAHHQAMRSQGEPPSEFYLAWLTGLFANSLVAVERVRREANAPGLEFALECVHVASGRYPLRDHAQHWINSGGPLPMEEFVFPRYSVGPPETFGELTRLFEIDVLNLSGSDQPDRNWTVDFARALAAIPQT